MSDAYTQLARLNEEQNAFFSTFPTEDRMAYAAHVTKCLSDADGQLSEMDGEVIHLAHMFAHVVSLMKKTPGEIPHYDEVVRTVLVDTDGHTYQATGEGIRDSIAVLTTLFGPAVTWPKEGIPVKVQEIKTRQGYTTYKLVVASEEDLRSAPSSDRAVRRSRK